MTQKYTDCKITDLPIKEHIGAFAYANSAYHNHDALGSVRPRVDEDQAVSMAKGDMPYGEVLECVVNAASSYVFLGEAIDVSGLILRA